MYKIVFTDCPDFTPCPCRVLINGTEAGDIIRLENDFHFILDEELEAPFCFSDTSPMGAVLQYIKWLEVNKNV